ncbi:unnamed protein product [Timema podura]|uniref:RING-type domain-containing protein n=1 Tax=Timema podura TaxID=61482 RepID=A0ABN7P823_TIMPD|nr:unnamed protein product [Timema podura]
MILEPYGLRQRSVIMGYYYPERAKQRSVWLYNRILRITLSRRRALGRQAHKQKFLIPTYFISLMSLKQAWSSPNRKVLCGLTVCTTLRSWLVLLRSPKFLAGLLGKLFGPQRNKACLLCAHVVRESRGEILVCCPKPDCVGQFCQKCFSDLDNLCTVCLEPVQYGDISDVSIEKESSDEDDLHTPSRLDPELGLEEGDPLNYEYQEDYQNDSNEGKPPLAQVYSNTGLLTVRPTLSSTQIFNEPLPDDFEVRRTWTLELLESEVH